MFKRNHRFIPYQLNPSSATLCKLIDKKIYFPSLGIDGIFDPEKLPINFSDILVKQLEPLFPSEAFGCCGSYLECSNKKTCVHIDPYYASGCMYKKSLDAGKIFYGANKNV